MARRGGDRYASERWLVEQMAVPIAEELEQEAYATLVRDLMRLRYQITRQEAEAEAYERTHGKWMARAKVVAYDVLEQMKKIIITQIAMGDSVEIDNLALWFSVRRAARRYRLATWQGHALEGVKPATTVPAARFSKVFKRQVKALASYPAVGTVAVPLDAQNG